MREQAKQQYHAMSQVMSQGWGLAMSSRMPINLHRLVSQTLNVWSIYLHLVDFLAVLWWMIPEKHVVWPCLTTRRVSLRCVTFRLPESALPVDHLELWVPETRILYLLYPNFTLCLWSQIQRLRTSTSIELYISVMNFTKLTWPRPFPKKKRVHYAFHDRIWSITSTHRLATGRRDCTCGKVEVQKCHLGGAFHLHGFRMESEVVSQVASKVGYNPLIVS